MTDQNNEEELNIDGSTPPPAVLENETNTKATTNNIHVAQANLSDLVGPGSTDEEFLDALLAVPTDKLIPWEECMLPSQGLYYGWPDGVCKVRPMGQVAEKILATQRLAASGQSIDYLFRECCRFPEGFDASELLLGDRIFLLYFLRGITHGNLYEFVVTCPNTDCQAVNTQVYDLNDLAATIRVANSSLGKEPFKVTLPYLSEASGRNVWVQLRFLRAYDANEMVASRRVRNKLLAKPGGVRSKARDIARQRAQETNDLRRSAVDPRAQQEQNVALDNALDENLEKIIVSVMGNNDRLKIRAFVQKLHAQDTATIREWLRDNTPGIDNTIEIVCPNCNNQFTVELPITESFFRPSKRS